MKKLKSFVLSLLLIFIPIFSIFPNINVSANANDFYFKNFTADYYLKKQADGTSEMEVVEEMTAVFPSYNQNHGIERKIPFLNQNDTNLTMESTDNLKIEVTRNGEKEKAVVTAKDTYFNVRIGDADTYLHGEQTYVLKYKFVHVITEFDVSSYSETAFQELYWDSNGTGWDQPFNEINVRLHMDQDIYNNLKSGLEVSNSATYQNKYKIHQNNTTKNRLGAWCYVGRYSSNNQSRCNIEDIEDGISFSATALSAGENLTFVTNFNSDTFIVPENDFIKTLKVEDAKVDYYLSKDENGLAKLKVKEEIVALFPTKNEVDSFPRFISYVNSNKNAFITKNQDNLDLNITMDGETASWSLESNKNKGQFEIEIKDKNSRYIHGKHVITLEYELENVVSKKSQSVTRDSSDILSYQSFSALSFSGNAGEADLITVNIHLSDELKNNLELVREGKTEWTEKKVSAVCNDGSSIDTMQMSCKIEETEDGFSFTTVNLANLENYSTTVYFKDGTFKIPEPNRNYLYYIIFVVVVAILSLIVYLFYRKSYVPVKERVAYFKNKPVAPEYTPLKGFTAAQLAEIYLKPTKNPKVATMLELIIMKKVELVKGERKHFSSKYNWKVKVVDLSDLSKEQIDLLKILNSGHSVSAGDEIELTNHAYSNSLETAFKNYDSDVKTALIEAGCLEEKAKNKKTSSQTITSLLLKVFCIIIFMNFGIPLIFGLIVGLGAALLKAINFTPFSIYEGKWLLIPMIVLALVVFAALPILSGFLARYKNRTDKGLDISNYMEGLKLYIKMAEADRLKFLQSVEGADTSEEGIVKLNEKLLPYAALFGLEKSWMNELSKYYELHNETSPNWYASGFNYSIINSTMRSAVSRPIDTSSSSGSGGGYSSSSSSGGGGGGFSGGGGGGGGGGGW